MVSEALTLLMFRFGTAHSQISLNLYNEAKLDVYSLMCFAVNLWLFFKAWTNIPVEPVLLHFANLLSTIH